MVRQLALGTSLAATLLLAGCTYSDDTDRNGPTDRQQATPAQPAAPAPHPSPPAPDLRLEVDLAARQLHVLQAGSVTATYPVAVGSREWPTPTGEWTIKQVIFNPRWIPPMEAWAKNEQEKEPGDPDNPLGRAQLVYDAPNSIHGTNEPESLGKPVSHGSIRIANDVVLQLARMVMEAGGVVRDEAWFRQVEANRTQRQEVDLPRPVPISVVAQRSTTTGSSSTPR